MLLAFLGLKKFPVFKKKYLIHYYEIVKSSYYALTILRRGKDSGASPISTSSVSVVATNKEWVDGLTRKILMKKIAILQFEDEIDTFLTIHR